MHYPYVLVGGGLAAASAVEGIRSRDPSGRILMISRENVAPYHRPPLSKDLWFGKKKRDEIWVHPDDFYRAQGVELLLRREVIEVDAAGHTVTDDHGVEYGYDRLLLATGGKPRLLAVEGEDAGEVHYFRSLEDYLTLEERSRRVQHALVVGAGFIGLELAAALRHSGLEVTLLYPGEYPLERVLPRDLGLFVADFYRQKGVEPVSGESIVAFHESHGVIQARTRAANVVSTQMVVAGIGITPSIGLAEGAGLDVEDGILVDEFGRTSDPAVYAAGDVAEFPYLALEQRTRVEHWDHALQHGRVVGANMAGAETRYDILPMFFSDFFELGWEAVGEVSSALTVEPVWREENREGVLFYLRDDVVRGVLLWNRWGLVDWARGLIKAGTPTTARERAASIPTE
jgi:NADPH-dependent 2,4-dienoyl-CoA reductase/sulfur reductase-like enzyme